MAGSTACWRADARAVHPALSVIVFTVASGAGFGLAAWLGLFAALGVLAPTGWFGAAALGLSVGLATIGLLSSVLHLGHPERAWRAFSQWRSSWLSREGVASLAFFPPAAACALGWVWYGAADGAWRMAALALAVAAVATVVCTAMIYASLKPIPQWRNPWVLPVYLALAAASGAQLLAALGPAWGLAPWLPLLAAGATLGAWAVKALYWRAIDGAAPSATIASATGLGAYGTVRALDPPHTQENYLQREMGFRVARRHAAKLRRIVHAAAFAAPIALDLAAAALGGWPAVVLAGAGALVMGIGLLVERWLFFAQATHVVTLYYGKSAA